MNLTRIHDAIKPYKLREYKPIPVMAEGTMKRLYVSDFKITAKSPDDACFVSMKNLIELLRDQNVPEAIIRDVKNIASVQKIEEIDD